jgi:hypothetical protein
MHIPDSHTSPTHWIPPRRKTPVSRDWDFDTAYGAEVKHEENLQARERMVEIRSLIPVAVFVQRRDMFSSLLFIK